MNTSTADAMHERRKRTAERLQRALLSKKVTIEVIHQATGRNADTIMRWAALSTYPPSTLLDAIEAAIK